MEHASGAACTDADGWAAVLPALRQKPPPCPPGQTTIVPTPDGEASLAFTLERGRMVLDALAEPGSTLSGRPGARDQAPDRPGSNQFAALRGPVTDALPGGWPESQLDCCRIATAILEAGGVPDPLWPEPEAFARAALGEGTTLEPLVRRIREMHAAATPSPSPTDPQPTPHQQREMEAMQRRIGTILSLPVLQRLFGFAVDVDVPFDLLPDREPDRPSFLLVAPAWDPTVWTLARFDELGFAPASAEEVAAADDAGHGRWERYGGMRNLGVQLADQTPRFDLCTIDPATTTEGDGVQDDRRTQANCTKEDTPPRVATLRTGGLRLVDRGQLQTAQRCDAAARTDLPRSRIEDASALAVTDRLLVGLRRKPGAAVEWRSPQFRAVTYTDPRAAERWEHLGFPAPADASTWVETELVRQLGPASGRRRLELDASPLAAATRYEPVPLPGAPAATATKAQTDTAMRLITMSTVAAWGGEPMGLPVTETPKPHGGKGQQPGARLEWSSWLVDELDLSRHFAPVSTQVAQADPTTLGPLLRFGWAYFAGVATVFDGGFCLPHTTVQAVVQRDGALVLPPATDEGGRRFLRHERVDAPMVLLPDKHWTELKADLVQAGAMILRTGLHIMPGRRLQATTRLLVPPQVALHFAALHDVLRQVTQAQPPSGLPGAAILRGLEPGARTADKPARFKVGPLGAGERAMLPYYPDPAANLLVVALFARDTRPPTTTELTIPKGQQPEAPVDEESPGAALGEPLVVSVEAKWPRTPPVHLVLRAGPEKAAPSLVYRGRRWLTATEQLLAAPANGAAAVEAVELTLAPGTDLWVQAWFVPTRQHLARWFDAPEAACALAAVAGGGTNVAKGLDELGCPARGSLAKDRPAAPPGGCKRRSRPRGCWPA